MSSHHDCIAKLTEHLEEWDYQIDRLEHRLVDLPQEMHNKLEALKTYRASLILKIKEAELVVEQAMESLEHSTVDTLNAMELLFEDLHLDVQVDFN